MTIRVAIDVSAIPDEPVGAGRYVVELVRHLGRRGRVELTAICRRGDLGRWQRIAPAARVVAVVPPTRGRRLMWERVAMAGRARALGVDLLHSPHYTMPWRPRGNALPRVVTVHDMTFFDNPEWHERLKVLVFRRAIRVAAARADGVICVSDTTARRLQARHPPAGRMFVIPHGVDHERFTPDDADEEDAARLHRLGVRPPYIAFLSTIQPRKDVPTLVRAFDRLAADEPELQLVLAGGKGWSDGPAERAVEESPYRDRIVRPGWVADDVVPALYRAAAVVAYPALQEGFGLPALEALASGAPLVTTRGTAMEEFAAEAAVLIDPGDEEGLARGLAVCLGGGPEVERRRQLGFSIAARHTWDAAAAAHEDAYASVVEGSDEHRDQTG